MKSTRSTIFNYQILTKTLKITHVAGMGNRQHKDSTEIGITIFGCTNYFLLNFKLCRDLQISRTINLKKKNWARATGLSQAGPGPAASPDPEAPKRYAAVRSRSDGARPFFSVGRRMQAGAML
jgi:hypothetical protein